MKESSLSLTGIDDYGYINARVRALKAQLLHPSDYDKLLGERTVENLKIRLKDTVYGPDIQKSETLYSEPTRVINNAIIENLSRTTRKLLRITGGEPRLYLSILLGRWDVHNIKTILRGRIRGVETEKIESALMPAGVLDPIRLKALMRDKEPLKVLDRLATWGLSLPFVVGRELNKAVVDGDVGEMESYIDRSYFAWSLSRVNESTSNGELVASVLRKMIDVRNILASLVLIKTGTRPLGRIKYLEGGTLWKSVLNKLENTETLEEAYQILETTPYWKTLKDKAKTSLPVIERALEWHILQSTYASRLSDPLGIGVLLSYLFAKETEIINIRTIAYGLAFGLTKPEIREDLLILTG